ncbi:Mu transposase domain-containing protein [Spirillospora sp. CA-294931]|uniref:Mu transposase domain-containing protein n=1 Tax=Spirillospora sp. CA-294931 TaxID=3240042 RepID=UPI003D8E1BDB
MPGTQTMRPGEPDTGPAPSGEYLAIERDHLQPLPEERFETGVELASRVDRYGQITVRTNRYSVPARLMGRNVRVMLHTSADRL